jgi:Fe-S cluster biosynthesis and repair protein YggX
MSTLTCSRCGREAEGLENPPMPGPLGAKVHESVCAACWKEWQAMEVMVINELRLNFMDPGAQKILDRQMLEFLGLATAGDGAS